MILLETARLLFREHLPEDLEAYCEIEADPDVRRFVGGQPRSRAAAERKFRDVHLRPVRNRLRLWATVFKPDQRYIGYCGIYPHIGPTGPIAGEGVLAFYLAKPYWGRGLATEAGRAFVQFGFDELMLSRIVASVEVGNEASMAVMQKLGFQPAGVEAGETRTFRNFELRSSAAPTPPAPESR